jgi:hypothetical protein
MLGRATQMRNTMKVKKEVNKVFGPEWHSAWRGRTESRCAETSKKKVIRKSLAEFSKRTNALTQKNVTNGLAIM